MEADNVLLARRKTGGGAVYQDYGNSIFTFIAKKENHDICKNFKIITQSLKKFGVEATCSGRNDVVVGEKKISGSAFKNTIDRSLHHGTILVDVNKDNVQKYLNVNKEKLKVRFISDYNSSPEQRCR